MGITVSDEQDKEAIEPRKIGLPFITDYTGMLEILIDEPLIHYIDENNNNEAINPKNFWEVNTSGYFEVAPVIGDIREYIVTATTQSSFLNKIKQRVSGDVENITNDPEENEGGDTFPIKNWLSLGKS